MQRTSGVNVMATSVRTESVACRSGLDGTTFVLADATAGSSVRIWPALGFNCLSWHVHGQELLWTDPAVFTDARPTRSGIPILFPFPNRIRAGRFTWQGKDYQLPITDAQKQNAIHGFVCQRPWRVLNQGVDDQCGAWLTGVFRGAQDAPDCASLWPADYEIEVTYRLKAVTLLLDLAVRNPSSVDLPLGLGFHPYFRCRADEAAVHADGSLEQWVLDEYLPTGACVPLAGKHLGLFQGTPLQDQSFDDAYRFTESNAARRLRMTDGARQLKLELTASADFRELVVFTPPHREALCLEPYTCVTDAINLQAHGVAAGLQVLRPGAEWRGRVELRLVS
jgi:aldose 1-epimerase